MIIKFHCIEKENFKTPEQVIRAFSYTEYFIEPHSHDFYEVHFMLSGKTGYAVDGKSYKIEAGEALFLPPSVKHEYKFSEGEPLRMTIAFSLDTTDGESFLSGQSVGCFPLGDDLKKRAEALLCAGEGRDVFTPHVIGGKMLEILLSLFGAMRVSLPRRRASGEDARLCAAKEFVEQNIHRPLGCEEVAKACFLSSKQLGRLFVREMGCSLSDYITEQKLSYAKRLLRMSERSVKEIGLLLGFENECGFVSFFKRHQGISPGAYRKGAP